MKAVYKIVIERANNVGKKRDNKEGEHDQCHDVVVTFHEAIFRRTKELPNIDKFL